MAAPTKIKSKEPEKIKFNEIEKKNLITEFHSNNRVFIRNQYVFVYRADVYPDIECTVNELGTVLTLSDEKNNKTYCFSTVGVTWVF